MSKNNISTLINALPSHLAVFDANGTVIEVSDSWRAFARECAGESVLLNAGTNYPEVCRRSGRYVGADLQRATNGIRSVLEGRAAEFCMEYVSNTESGKRWFEMTVLPLEGEDGGAVVSHFDITDRVVTEARRSGFGQIFDRSWNEIYIFDAVTLRFSEVNEGARRNLGYALEELLSMTPADIKPEFTFRQFQELIKPLQSGEKPRMEFTTVHERKDGSRYPVEVHLQKMEFGEKPVFVAIILDITERTVTAEALARARQFLESAPDAMIIVDSTGEISVANSQAENIFGYSRTQLIGMKVERLVPDRFRKEHCRHRAGFMDQPRIRIMGSDLELYAVNRDGTEIPIEVSLSPINTGDGMLVAAAIRDVTRQHEEAEILAKAKQAAESATTTKTRFLAAASHDLRQPLQSIGLYLSALNRLLEQPRALEISGKIRDSLNVMGDILGSLLDMSKLESGVVAPSITDVSIQSIFEKIRVDNELHADRKGLDLEIENTLLVARTDAGLLQRVVENFVTNAIRYTESGRIRVRAIEDEPSASTAWLEVEDSGIGMPEEIQESIFDEYFQAENNVRDRGKGLGLGLSIVKHIAALLDLEVEVESEEGKGSIFRVKVPIAARTAKLPAEDAGAGEPPKGTIPTTVLFVEDDPAIVDGVRELFALINISLFTAGSGEEAMERLDQGVQPDMLISDYRLPDYNGVEVVRRVRQRTHATLPAVILTGDTSKEKIEDANLANCCVFYKPVDIDKLVAHIEGAI